MIGAGTYRYGPLPRRKVKHAAPKEITSYRWEVVLDCGHKTSAPWRGGVAPKTMGCEQCEPNRKSR
jgi:hypothetical protein